MPIPNPANQILDREFFQIRAQILALAASLDRLDRAPTQDAIAQDERVRQIREALELLVSEGTDRAAGVQLVFSDPYEEEWLRKFEIASR